MLSSRGLLQSKNQITDGLSQSIERTNYEKTLS